MLLMIISAVRSTVMFSPQIRIRVKKMISIANLFRLKEINEAEALDSLLSTIDGFKKFT